MTPSSSSLSSSNTELDPLSAAAREHELRLEQEQQQKQKSGNSHATTTAQENDGTALPPGNMPPLQSLSEVAQEDITEGRRRVHDGTGTIPEDTSLNTASAAVDGPADDALETTVATNSDGHHIHPSGMIIVSNPRLKRPPLRVVHLDQVPSKSILKRQSAYPFIEQPARSPIFKSQWLQTTVSKLAVMSGPATPTAYTANSPSMFRKLVTQATAATATTPATHPGQRLMGPPVFANNERPLPILESEESSASLLSDKSMKRVRFSVGQLTTEYVFHHDDAYESAEETETPSLRTQVTTTPQAPKKLLTTSDGVVVDDNIYTAKEIMNYYLVACSNREEYPIERLVIEMQAREPLPRKTLDPISDVLTLEFGLKQLYLDNCVLEDDTLKILLYSLLLTDTLTVLSIQDNKRIKAAGFKYISVFVKKASLKVLNVSGIAMDKRSAEFLAHALRVGRLGFGSRLEELRMDRCGLRGNLLEIMAPAIRESNLRQVSMRSNRIGSTGGVWIGVLMRDYDDQPNAVIPNNNEEQGFKRVFPGISNPELLKRTHGVEFLDISDNDLRQGADFVAQILRRNMSLKRLVMANNNLGPARLAVLADALKLNIGLESLDISNNAVCGPVITGVIALTQKLNYNKTLTKLTLSNTGLQSEGAIALAEFLPETRTLTQLDLTGNDLVDIAGVMALSVSIRMNKSLTCLDMNVPPNDAEFARLSRDILRACVRNMEEKTGSNAGMPSTDDMPTNTIFRQPSSIHIPEPAGPSDDDKRWMLLEGVAGELYRARETLNAMEKALNYEKAMRRNWLERFNHRASLNASSLGATTMDDGQIEQQQQEQQILIPATPEEKRMLEIAKGALYRAPLQCEQLYHQCKRHQAIITSLNTRITNDKALQELETMHSLLTTFLDAYRGLFALPELPPHFVVGKRTNSLPPTDSENSSNANSSTNSSTIVSTSTPVSEQENGTDKEPVTEREQEQTVPEPLTEEPIEDLESSFLLEDEDDMDDEIYTNDALIDAHRTSLLVERRPTPPPAETNENQSLTASRLKGLRPSTLTTSTMARTDTERSPSILASPLEKLRKAEEEEEGEALRRGKELLENEDGLAEEALSGEELSIQILAGDSSP
ncbi:hypothetical protein BGZ99_007226 [Dissophora globulifera]|uniref:RNI-like protein n=1 Tax=Dissophora globulifera TaxID=979702 RepID=A0A9P6UZD2_9FUNG|nr:hypothetical protein BGZ99_007226 [Dissophora globulifera]